MDASVSYCDILIIGSKGQGLSTTAHKILVANPSGKDYTRDDIPSVEMTPEGLMKCTDISGMWSVHGHRCEKNEFFETHLKHLHYSRTKDKPHEEIDRVGTAPWESKSNESFEPTIKCEVLSNETSKIRIINFLGFFDEAIQLPMSTRDINVTMQKILYILTTLSMKFTGRILYFLSCRGPLDRHGAAMLSLELRWIASVFNHDNTIFKSMVLVATVPPHLSKMNIPDDNKFTQEDVKVTKDFFRQALDKIMSNNPAVAAVDPPLIFISLTDTCEQILAKIKAATVQQYLQFDHQSCTQCGIKIEIVNDQRVLCYMGEGLSNAIPYKESTCHPKFFPKLTESPMQAFSTRKCVLCGRLPNTLGCMQVGEEFGKGQEKVIVDHKISDLPEESVDDNTASYTDAEEEKHIMAVQKAMENKGVLDHTIVHGVFVGLARSGKDSLMKRLLGKKLSSTSPSTGVAENTVQVNVMEKSTTITTNIEESRWTEMDYNDEAIKLMLISTHNKMLSLKQLKESPIYQEGILVEALVTMPLHFEDEVAGNVSVANPIGRISASTMSPDHQKQVNPLSYKIIHPPVMPGVLVPNPLDILKGALQSKGLEALKQHFQKTWSLYLTNTGGQMEFQEVLPLLVSGPSIFFFTFRLDRDLNEYYSIEYEYAAGRKSYPYTATSTTIEGILHTLGSISAMGTFVYQGLQKREAPLRPKVFFIGTHKDKLNPNLAASHIASVDRQLQEIITSTTHYKDLVEFASPSQLIFTVNNFSESESDFQGIRSAVERVVMRGDFQMTSPAHWLIFSLALRKLKYPVVSYDLCYKVAKQCGIESREDLTEALYFIHSKMGLIRYFPYEELRDIVIIDPQFLFDKVTELIVDTFTFEKVGKSEMDEFKRKGIFSISEFEQKPQSEINSLQFGKLLVHLRIAAPFEMDKKKKLFLPCVLAHANKSKENLLPSTPVPALLIAFEHGYCPKGVPGALITYLMTNEMESSTHWVLLTDEIFKDQISFRVGAYDVVVIKIFPTHFELNCIPDPLFEDQRISSPIEDTCIEVLKAVNTAIPQLLKDLNYLMDKSQHLLTFQCQAPQCKDNSHPAKLILDSSGCSGSLMCQKTKQCFKLPTNSYYWGYGENPCQESHLHASSRSESKCRQPQLPAKLQQKHASQTYITEQEHSLQEHATQATSKIHTQLTEQSQNLVTVSSQQPAQNSIRDSSKNQQISQLNVKQHYSILHKQLIKHSDKWTEIASHLGFLPSETKIIQTDPLLLTDAPASWFRTMLEQWLQWAPGDSRGSNNFATLEDLKEALSQAGLGTTAHNLHT